MSTGSTTVTLRDYRGKTAKVHVVLTAADAATLLTAAGTFLTDLVACSNAVAARQTGLNENIEETVSYGAATQYASVEQKLVLTGLGADGRLHRLSIPAPAGALFNTDQITANIGAGALATLVTFLNAHWVSNDGEEVAITVVSGVFRDRRRKVKLGPWSRTATGGAAPG